MRDRAEGMPPAPTLTMGTEDRFDVTFGERVEIEGLAVSRTLEDEPRLRIASLSSEFVKDLLQGRNHGHARSAARSLRWLDVSAPHGTFHVNFSETARRGGLIVFPRESSNLRAAEASECCDCHEHACGTWKYSQHPGDLLQRVRMCLPWFAAVGNGNSLHRIRSSEDPLAACERETPLRKDLMCFSVVRDRWYL